MQRFLRPRILWAKKDYVAEEAGFELAIQFSKKMPLKFRVNFA